MNQWCGRCRWVCKRWQVVYFESGFYRFTPQMFHLHLLHAINPIPPNIIFGNSDKDHLRDMANDEQFFAHTAAEKRTGELYIYIIVYEQLLKLT